LQKAIKNRGEVKTIMSVVKDGLCCGCGTCAGICPRDAIEMTIDKRRGIYLPCLDDQKCNGCSICLDACPGREVNLPQFKRELFPDKLQDPLVGSYLQCYLGYASDQQMRYNCTSGGLATTFLIYALEQGLIDGALVSKMNDERPLEPQPFIARTREEVISAAGSKYCPVPANVALKEILKTEGRYAVVGLPCHMHGIRKSEAINAKLRERIVFHLGIFCSKNISFLGTEFQLKRMGIRKEAVEKISYRGRGWPGNMTIRLKGKQKEISEFYPSYDDIKLNSFVIPRCTLCFDWVAELADISFGDAWLPEIKANDKIGTSIVIARSELSNNIMCMATERGYIESEPVRTNEVKRSQQFFTWKKREIAARFALNKIMGRKLPEYHQALAKPALASYLNAIILASQMFFASRPYRWKMLDLYCYLLGLPGK